MSDCKVFSGPCFPVFELQMLHIQKLFMQWQKNTLDLNCVEHRKNKVNDKSFEAIEYSQHISLQT